MINKDCTVKCGFKMQSYILIPKEITKPYLTIVFIFREKLIKLIKLSDS